jgi:S-adenosylmethionine hydrolase
MGKKHKLTEEELKILQDKMATMRAIKEQVGDIEGQKHLLLHQLVKVQNEMQDHQILLKDKYGNMSVNINDGTLSEIQEEA